MFAFARWFPLFVALVGCVQPGTRIDDGTSCVVVVDGDQPTDSGYQTTDGGNQNTDGGLKLETPTDLVAVEQNDINAVQVTWTSHSTGDTVSWVEQAWVFLNDPTNKVNSRLEKLNNGDILGSSLDVREIKELKFRVKDCLRNDANTCSSYSGAISVPILPLDVKAPTNVIVTEIPSEKGPTYRAIHISWTDNSYGELYNEIYICTNPAWCPSGGPLFAIILSAPSVPPTTMTDVDFLPSNTPLWILVGMSVDQGHLLAYPQPVKITTSP